jgi:elongation factor Ts
MSTEALKTLRKETGVSFKECKKALEEAGGDLDKAREVLASYSTKAAAKKSDRELGAGLVVSYVHANGSVGTMIELQCETDYVTRNEDFLSLGKDLALHITAMGSTEETLKDEPFVKDPSKTITKVLEEGIQKIGERIEIKQFVRFDTTQK